MEDRVRPDRGQRRAHRARRRPRRGARTIYCYATGIDTRDWALYRSIFTDEIAVDFSSYDGNPPSRVRADDWVEGVQPLFHGLDATQHTMTNPRVRIESDRPTCVMYMQAVHFLANNEGDAEFTLGGKTVRLGTKSIRCEPLLRRILDAGKVFQGLLTYTVEETKFLADKGHDDFLVAYPTVQPTDLILLTRLTGEGKREERFRPRRRAGIRSTAGERLA